MRNFMSYERRWLDEPHVGDHVGRSVWALGEVLSTAWVPAVVGPAQSLLATLVASLRSDVSLRTAAYAVLGLARLDPDRRDPEAQLRAGEPRRPARGRASGDRVGGRGTGSRTLSATTMPVCPHALVVGGAALDRWDHVALGLVSLRWLGDECGLAGGALRLPGHLGRHRDEPAPGAGDEQPLDASAFVEAELAAFAVTGEPDHGTRAQVAFDWFLGRNRLDRPLYDFATGGCSDGLGEDD